MRRVVRSHGSVEVVEITSGDAFPKGVTAVTHSMAAPTPDAYRAYGSRREREVLHAMRQLGIARSRIRLLGFPDEGLCELANPRARDSELTHCVQNLSLTAR